MTSFDYSPWPRRRLGDVCLTNETVDPRRQPGKIIRYIDISCVSNKTLRIEKCTEITGADAPSRARKVVRTGDVIFATTRPYLRSIAPITPAWDGAVCSTGFCVLRPGDLLDPQWAYYLAISDDLLGQVTPKMRGANYPAVTDGDVLDSVVPLPPIAEQRRIVARIQEAMARVDEIQRLRNETIAEASAMTQAARYEAFLSGAPMMKLGALIADGPTNGLYKPSTAYGSGTPILRINNFNGGDRFTGGVELKRLQVDPEEARRFSLHSSDFVINRVNGSLAVVGKACTIECLDEPTVFESNMMRFAVDEEKVNRSYLLHFLASPQCRDQIKAKAKVIQQASINQPDVLSFLLPLPPMGEQKCIAERLDQLAGRALALRQELLEDDLGILALPSAILRRAFAGEL